MADEITVTAVLQFDNGITIDELSAVNLLRDSGTTELVLHNMQSIGTTEEAVTVGDCTGNCYLIIINRDPTNYVQLYHGAGGTAVARLQAGDVALFRKDTGCSLYAKANTAACVCEIFIVTG